MDPFPTFWWLWFNLIADDKSFKNSFTNCFWPKPFPLRCLDTARHGTVTSPVFPPTISPIAWNGHLKTEIRLELKDCLLISYQLRLYFRCYLSAKPVFWRTILSDICESVRVKALVTQSCLTLCNPMDCIHPGSSVPWNSPGKNMEWVAIPSSRDLTNPGIEPRSPA